MAVAGIRLPLPTAKGTRLAPIDSKLSQVEMRGWRLLESLQSPLNSAGISRDALRRVRDHAVAAVMLGAIERVVGALEDIADGLALAVQRRQPDRDRDLDALGSLADHERLTGDRTPQPFRHHAGDMQIGLGHHDHEFLAAIAAGEIAAPDRP